LPSKSLTSIGVGVIVDVGVIVLLSVCSGVLVASGAAGFFFLLHDIAISRDKTAIMQVAVIKNFFIIFAFFRFYILFL
jgi:hypothetical protein